jgi:hypothetical protein
MSTQQISTDSTSWVTRPDSEWSTGLTNLTVIWDFSECEFLPWNLPEGSPGPIDPIVPIGPIVPIAHVSWNDSELTSSVSSGWSCLAGNQMIGEGEAGWSCILIALWLHSGISHFSNVLSGKVPAARTFLHFVCHLWRAQCRLNSKPSYMLHSWCLCSNSASGSTSPVQTTTARQWKKLTQCETTWKRDYKIL